MANTVRLKRSAVAGKIPLTTDLELGELAINTRDGKVYIKRNDGTTDSIVEVGANEPQVLTTKRVITSDITLDASNNMMSINDVTVADGVVVEVPADSTWIVVG